MMKLPKVNYNPQPFLTIGELVGYRQPEAMVVFLPPVDVESFNAYQEMLDKLMRQAPRPGRGG